MTTKSQVYYSPRADQLVIVHPAVNNASGKALTCYEYALDEPQVFPYGVVSSFLVRDPEYDVEDDVLIGEF